MYEIIERLNRAYGTSTPSTNNFKEAINAIEWEDVFEADGETYYTIGELTLTVENINPFEQNWKPSVMYKDFYRELGWM